MIKVRNYLKTEYPLIASWWNQVDEPCPSSDMLPEDSTLVLEDEGRAVATACIYLTNTPAVGFIEHLIADPSYTPAYRKKALELLALKAEEFAKERGCKQLFGTVRNAGNKPALLNRYKEAGYTVKGLDFALVTKRL